MKVLKVFDQKDYEDCVEIFEKKSVRAIIIRDGKIAMQQGRRGDYKILGGGVDTGETLIEALSREVREEAGLLVKEESVHPIGEMTELRRDRFEPQKKYICHSYFFFCDVEDTTCDCAMTQSELEKGYHLVWAQFDEIIVANEIVENEPWMVRDTEFIKMLQSGQIRYDWD